MEHEEVGDASFEIYVLAYKTIKEHAKVARRHGCLRGWIGMKFLRVISDDCGRFWNFDRVCKTLDQTHVFVRFGDVNKQCRERRYLKR